MMSEKFKNLWAEEGMLKLLLFLIPFLYGGFFPWCAALAVLVLVGSLLVKLWKNGRLELRLSWLQIITILLPVCYGLSCIWAVDHGEAPFGVLRTLPLPLLVLVLQQIPERTRGRLLSAVPVSGAVMTVLSGAAALLPQFRGYVLIDGRLSGFFQYPNVYALFLLAGLILLSWVPAKERSAQRIILAVLLGAGLVFSGSRTVFLLAIAAAVIRVLLEADRKVRIISVAVGASLVAAVLITAAVFPASVLGRYLKITAGSSTLLGRLLYWQDAIPVILHHPFGLGYLGYYYAQGSFQTGVYSARYVHNSILQLMLDVGWLPGLLTAVFFGYLLVHGIRKAAAEQDPQQKRNAKARWMLLLVIFAHSLFDFSLEFLAIWLILVVAADEGKIWKSCTLKSRTAAVIVSLLLACPSAYFGVVSVLEKTASPETVLHVYPNDTPALMDVLRKCETTEELDTYGRRIIRLDSKIALAHDAVARAAYSNGDVSTMLSEKQLSLECAKYEQSEYRDYFAMLQVVYQLYLKQGDSGSVDYCRYLLQNIPDQMEQVLRETSSLGTKIRDLPELTLTEDQLSWLDSIS